MAGKQKDSFSVLNEIIAETMSSADTRNSIKEFTSLVTVHNYIVLRMLFSLKKILSETDKKKIKDVLRTVFNMSEERSNRIIKAAENVPVFLKDENLLGSVIDLSRILSLEDSDIPFNKALKYSTSKNDRLLKELENKDKVIAKLLLLYAKKTGEKYEYEYEEDEGNESGDKNESKE